MRRFKFTTALIFCLLLLTGCTGEFPQKNADIHIVCTIFPEYDWTRQIVGDIENVQVTLLVKNGTDLHSYQPSVQDIAQIAQADLFCYAGGVSDDWVLDVLKTAENDNVTAISMLEAADAKEENLVLGMQEESHHHSRNEPEEGEELDEHVWLSLRQAQLDCLAICDALCALDEAHASQYQTNCENYLQQLQELDALYTEKLEQNTARDTILMADRFPFRYLAEDYGLTYYAAFPGCSTETNASFETIVFLAEQMQEKQIPYLLVTESGDTTLAEAILKCADTEGEILTLCSMQSVTEKQLQEGLTYLGQMKQNLTVLLKALS